MSLSSTKFGDFELYSIETGDFKLDGGAMFGVVPKTLWSRGIPADDKNRIPMTMRCLLIRSENTGRLYLVDNGVGTKFDQKMNDIYQIDHSTKELMKSLEHHGFKPEDITDIIFTHLHFDHCGGTTYFDENGDLQHAFPNATYHVTRTHWQTATDPNAREKASFLPDNIAPLMETDRLNLVGDPVEYEKGLTAVVVNGHTKGQQLPRIEKDGQSLVFVADLLPTHVHVPLPWVMGYDMYPATTLEEKKDFLDRASDENWFLFLEHDIKEEIIQISRDGKKYKVANTLTLDQL